MKGRKSDDVVVTEAVPGLNDDHVGGLAAVLHGKSLGEAECHAPSPSSMRHPSTGPLVRYPRVSLNSNNHQRSKSSAETINHPDKLKQGINQGEYTHIHFYYQTYKIFTIHNSHKHKHIVLKPPIHKRSLTWHSDLKNGNLQKPTLNPYTNPYAPLLGVHSEADSSSSEPELS